MSDYQSGPSAIEEAAKVCDDLARKVEEHIDSPFGSIGYAAAISRNAYENAARSIRALPAEITIARCNLLFLEECCRYSLGLAEDLIGDALTKAVGDKVLAMRDEAAALRAALRPAKEALVSFEPRLEFSDDDRPLVEQALAAIANLKAPVVMSDNEPSEDRVNAAARALQREDPVPMQMFTFDLARAVLTADAPALIEARIAGMREALSIIGLNRIRLDDAFQVNDSISALQADLDKERGKTT